MNGTVEDHAERIEAAMLGALAGEAAAGTAAGAADLLGVAESVAAEGGFDEADLRARGLERPSRVGSAGLLLRAVPFALLTPLDRPQLRRAAHRCVSIAGADQGTAVTAVAVAMLAADLMRFDLETSVIRVHQSLLEDAPTVLLDSLHLVPDSAQTGEGETADATGALRAALAALSAGECDVRASVAAAAAGNPASLALAGCLAGAHQGAAALPALDASSLPHGDRACQIARRLAERISAAEPAASNG